MSDWWDIEKEAYDRLASDAKFIGREGVCESVTSYCVPQRGCLLRPGRRMGVPMTTREELQSRPSAEPRTVLCFGDSLTWGFDPRGGASFVRYGFTERWTRRLQAELGPSYYVIEDGLNGCTTVFDDPVLGRRSGLAQLPTALETHMPIDLVVILLGSNDAKARFGVNSDDIARCLGRLLDVVAKSNCGPGGKAPQTLVLVPPTMGDVSGSWLEPMFDSVHSKAALQRLGVSYPTVAAAFGAHCFDLNPAVGPRTFDGLHFDPDTLQPLAAALAEKILGLFGGSIS
jgi:lysophospholipase L1-like esterase